MPTRLGSSVICELWSINWKGSWESSSFFNLGLLQLAFSIQQLKRGYFIKKKCQNGIYSTIFIRLQSMPKLCQNRFILRYTKCECLILSFKSEVPNKDRLGILQTAQNDPNYSAWGCCWTTCYNLLWPTMNKYIKVVYMNIAGQSFGVVWDASSVSFYASPGRVCRGATTHTPCEHAN